MAGDSDNHSRILLDQAAAVDDGDASLNALIDGLLVVVGLAFCGWGEKLKVC